MKKLSASLLLISSILFTSTGCLKDDNFNKEQSGIQITDTKGISFPQSYSSLTIPIAFSLNSSTSPQSVSTSLTLESTDSAQANIDVALTTDTVGFAKLGLTQLPATGYNLSLAQVIPVHKRSVPVTITFPNTTTLNPTIKYGIALNISSVSAGYQIAANLKRVILSFNIKNRYDGIYTIVSGTVQRYTAPGAPEAVGGLNGNLTGNPDVYLITSGANSVAIPPSGQIGAIYWAFGSSSQVAGVDNIQIAVNPTTYLTTTTSLGNASLANWENKENKYDPATQTFTLNFRWNPTSNRREYSVVLKYKGPR